MVFVSERQERRISACVSKPISIPISILITITIGSIFAPNSFRVVFIYALFFIAIARAVLAKQKKTIVIEKKKGVLEGGLRRIERQQIAHCVRSLLFQRKAESLALLAWLNHAIID